MVHSCRRLGPNACRQTRFRVHPIVSAEPAQTLAPDGMKASHATRLSLLLIRGMKLLGEGAGVIRAAA